MTLRTEVDSGDLRRGLEAVRDLLARKLSRPGDQPIAPMARVLVDVMARIDALPDTERQSTVDDLTHRRAARRQAATGS